MFFIIYGFRDNKLKSKPVKGNTVCGKCNSVESFDVKGTASYFYLFWIPIIPLGKIIEFTCRRCGQHHYKKTASKLLLDNYKKDPLRRPWWHFVFLILVAYQVVNLLGYLAYSGVDSIIEESKRNTKIEQDKDEQDFNISQLKTALNNANEAPIFTKDSISYLLNKELNMKAFGLDKSNISFYSEVKNNMVLTLFNIKDFNALDKSDKMLFLKSIRDIINKSYPKQSFLVSIGIDDGEQLVVSTNNNDLVVYNDDGNYEHYDYPLKDFYENDSVPKFLLNAQLRHYRFLYEYEGKSSNKTELDTTKLINVWNKINNKYKFKYKGKIKPLPKSVYLTSSEILLPKDLWFFLKYQNLNGPFNKLDKLEVRLREMNQLFYRTPLSSLTNEKYGDKSKRIMPVAVSPRWLPFYEDYTYRYAMDMLPDENGYIGQIIQLGQNGEPNKFIAKDLVSFLELYLNEKVPTNVGDWN
jgi:hypothetical protein